MEETPVPVNTSGTGNQNQPVSPKTTNKSFLWLSLGLILLIAFGGWLYRYYFIKTTPPVSLSKTASQSAKLTPLFDSFQGIVVSATKNAITIKTTSGTQTYNLSSKFIVQKTKPASGSANFKLDSRQTLPISEIQTGQLVSGLVNKNTRELLSLLIIKDSLLPKPSKSLSSEQIQAKNPDIFLQGNIESINQAAITIKTNSGNQTYIASNKVIVQKIISNKPKPSSLVNLKTGDQVIVTVEKSTNLIAEISSY